MDIEYEIQNWLVEEGIFKQKIPDENANFHFIVNYPDGHIIDVIQPKAKNDMIVIGCATNVSPEHAQIMESSNEKKNIKFIFDIRFIINQFLLDFELNHPNNVLQNFIITDEMYLEAINKHNLIMSVKKVFKVKLHCVWTLEKTFGNINKDIKKSNDNGMYV